MSNYLFQSKPDGDGDSLSMVAADQLADRDEDLVLVTLNNPRHGAKSAYLTQEDAAAMRDALDRAINDRKAEIRVGDIVQIVGSEDHTRTVIARDGNFVNVVVLTDTNSFDVGRILRNQNVRYYEKRA
jgi:hypothetical protein